MVDIGRNSVKLEFGCLRLRAVGCRVVIDGCKHCFGDQLRKLFGRAIDAIEHWCLFEQQISKESGPDRLCAVDTRFREFDFVSHRDELSDCWHPEFGSR